MKAIICSKYGATADLQFMEIDKPTPKENELLIKVVTTAVNDYDWGMVRGKPTIYRLFFGFSKPKKPIPGMELSGIVEQVGSSVTLFKIGDAVYGDISNYGFGSFAEYICINEKAVVLKPAGMSFTDAAAISHASMLAYQAIVEKGKIQPKQKILINGAGGGVGTFGLQIAKLFNAEVTGVDTGNKLNMMKSIGFNHVIDYKKEDFTKNRIKYDLVIDAKTNRSPLAYLRSLNANSKYVTIGGQPGRLIQLLLLKFWIRLFTKKRLLIVTLKSNRDLDYIHKLYAEGKIKPVIDGPYPLNEAPKAIQHFGEGKHTGKVIIIL
ncbi:MAG: NAD(P)-dependent alcohol dehydrogenase [Chitinophagaceae bacterium]